MYIHVYIICIYQPMFVGESPQFYSLISLRIYPTGGLISFGFGGRTPKKKVKVIRYISSTTSATSWFQTVLYVQHYL